MCESKLYVGYILYYITNSKIRFLADNMCSWVSCKTIVGLRNTSSEKEKNKCGSPRLNELLLILRAYHAHPTRWIDILNHVKAYISKTTPSALQDMNISSGESRMSVKPGKLMFAGVIGDEEIR